MQLDAGWSVLMFCAEEPGIASWKLALNSRRVKKGCTSARDDHYNYNGNAA